METTKHTTPINLMGEAQQFLQEVSNASIERKKKNLPSATGLQVFLLFVRANARVPDHHVKGPITVQTLIGNARMSAEGKSFDLAPGDLISFAAEMPHDVAATSDSVLVVTHAF